MRVVKQRRGGIIRRVELVDDGGQPLEVVCRFLSHLADRGYSPHTLCAYCYDLRHLFVFLERDGRSWSEFGPADALRLLGYLRRLPTVLDTRTTRDRPAGSRAAEPSSIGGRRALVHLPFVPVCHAGSGPVRVGDRGLGHFDVLVAACLQELFGAEPAQLGVWARTDDDLTEGLLGEADADVGHDPEVPARSEEQVRSSVDGHPPLVLFLEGGVLDAGQPRQNLTLCVRVSTGAGVSRGWQAFHLCDEWGDGLGAVEDSLESSSDLLCRRGQRCGVESEREAPAPAIAAPLTEEVMVVAETSNEHLGVAVLTATQGEDDGGVVVSR